MEEFAIGRTPYLMGSYYDVLYVLGIVWTLALWTMMIVFPKMDLTKRLLRSPAIIAPHLLLYGLVAFPTYFNRFDEVLHPKESTTIPHLLLGTEGYDLTPIGYRYWALHAFNLHLITLNLFLGRWVYWDGRAKNLDRIAHTLALILTMWSGPLGLAFYLGALALTERKPKIKAAVRRVADVAERTGMRIEGAVEGMKMAEK